MSGEDEVMTSILDWFGQIEEWIPEAGKWAADLIIGPIPKAYANNAYDLAEQWGHLADTLNDAYEDVMQAANPILENWSGDGAAQVFTQEWFAYLEGLRQTAQSAAQMQRGAQNFGLEIELMKFMAALNLIMLAVSIYMLIAAAIPTAGAALGAAPGLFAAARVALWKAATTAVSKIAAIELRIVMRSLATLFTRLPGAIASRVAPSVIRAAAPRIASRAGQTIAAAFTREAIRRAAHTVVARGISKAVANRLAAQTVRGLAGRQVSGVLGRQTTREAQRQLSKEIRRQLMLKWARGEVQGAAGSTVQRIAASRVAQAGLGREFAKYVGVRVGFGTGFMAGGNLLGQFGQIASGNRTEGVDWGQVKTNAIQGAAFGAGMFGGVIGHGAGGALAGGGLTLAQEAYDYARSGGENTVDWGAVRHTAAEGAMAGVIFGGQTTLENANISMPHTRIGSVRIGADVQFLPGENGGFNLASTRANGREAMLLTSDGYVALERDGIQSVPDQIAERSGVIDAMNQHFPSGAVDTSAPPASRADGGGGGGSGPRSGENAGGPRQGGGDRDPGSRTGQNDGGGSGPRTPERVRVPAAEGTIGEQGPAGDRGGRSSEPGGTGDRSPGENRSPAGDRGDGPDGGPPDGGAPARPDGDVPAGARTDGDLPAGARADGDLPAGTRADGDLPAGTRADGDLPAGTRTDGDVPARVRSDGDTPTGVRGTGDRGPVGESRIAPDTPVPGDRAPGADRGTGEASRAGADGPAPGDRLAGSDRGPAGETRTLPDQADRGTPERGTSDHGSDVPPATRPGDGTTGTGSVPHIDPSGRDTGTHAGDRAATRDGHDGTPQRDGESPVRATGDDGPPGGPHPPAVGDPVPEAMTGASIRPRDEVAAYDWADRAYDRFRADDADVGEIAGHLADAQRPDGSIGYTPAEIHQIKQHLMVEPHRITDYDGTVEVRRFDASPDIAEAWIRLREGRHLPEDLVLLNHELAESNYMRQHPDSDYREAHNAANQQHNWQDMVPARTGEDLDVSYGRQRADGDPGRLPENPRGRETGGVSVRAPGDGPGAGDRERVTGGQSGGRDGGPDVRGGVHQDPADAAGTGDLAGGRDVRGVDPYRLVPVDGPVPDNPVAAPREVAAVLDAHMGDLVTGRDMGAPDQPHRAEWNPESRTLRVHYGDGLQVDVVVQVNDSVPPGRAVVVRPPLEPLEGGGWRQTEPAGVVLSSHMPGDPVARASHVGEALDAAWRTVHEEVGAQLRPEDAVPPRDADAVPPRDADAVPPRDADAVPPRDAPGPEALRALEETTSPDVPLRDADGVGRHRAESADAPAPAPLTPDNVRQTLAGNRGPEQLPRWAGDHLADRDQNGTPRPKDADEINAIVDRYADEAIDTVTPAETVRPGEMLHTASPIPDTAFVPDGRPWDQPDVTLGDLQRSVHGVLSSDFGDGTIAYVGTDGGLQVRVEMTDGTVRHLQAEVGWGMDSLAETRVRSGTPEDPHIVRVNNRVAADQLPRVWVHEITETLALQHAQENRAQPHGLVRRALHAIGRVFGAEQARPDEPVPDAVRVDAHAAARINERLYLQRLHDWAHNRPEEQMRLRLEIEGVDRDLQAMGRVDPQRIEQQLHDWGLPDTRGMDPVIGARPETIPDGYRPPDWYQNDGPVRPEPIPDGYRAPDWYQNDGPVRPETGYRPPDSPIPDSMYRTPDGPHPDSAYRAPDWSRTDGPEGTSGLRPDDSGADGGRPSNRDVTPPDAAPHEVTPARDGDATPHEVTPSRDGDATPHDSRLNLPHDDGPRQPGEPRTPLRELFPDSESLVDAYGQMVERVFVREMNGRDFAGFDVRVDSVRAHPGHVEVRLSVVHPDRPGSVGSIVRDFTIDRTTGALEVFHARLVLDPGMQGSGFARAFNDHMQGWYTESGVSRVSLHAASSVGGYAWARDGYGWNPDFGSNQPHEAFRRLRSEVARIDQDLNVLIEADVAGDTHAQTRILDRYGIDDAATAVDRLSHELREAQQLLERSSRSVFGQPDYPTPYEVSQVGRTDQTGADGTWIGKRTMMGHSWHGTREPEMRPEAPLRAEPEPPHDHDGHHSRDSARTNLDVLLNGSDVPFHHDAVAHVADLMGADLSGVRVHLVTDGAEMRHMDERGISAVTPPEMGGREMRLGPAAFADAETLAATVAHELTHVQQLRDGRELGPHTLRALEDEAFAGEAAALERFRQGFEGWEGVRDGTVSDRGDSGSPVPGRSAGDGPPAGRPDRDGGDAAGRGDRYDGEGDRGGVSSTRGPDDLGGGTRDTDAGGRRPGPDDLNRPIGGRRDDGPPFDYEQFYRDGDWTPEALRFEMRLGAHFFNDPATLNAAREAVTQLRDVLTALATDGVTNPEARAVIARDVEAAFFRSDEGAFESAGQVGHGVPLSALLHDGNLRELTTAFYNAAYFNRGSPHTLSKMLIDVIDGGRWDAARRAGVDIDELSGMHRQLDHSFNRAIVGRLEDLLPADMQRRFYRDPFATGNVVMRSDRPYHDLVEVISSQLGRRTRLPDEQLLEATTPEHYQRLGVPLGRYEGAFVQAINGGPLAPDAKLPWREGYVSHDTGSSRWAQQIGRDGYPVLDGISATTTRMLTGAKLIGIHDVHAQQFLKVLVGWMLPARDHSLIELLRGASIAGVEPTAVHSRSVRPTAIDLYRNLPGVDLHTIRTQIADGGLLPHESRYLHHATRPDGFSEVDTHVRSQAQRLSSQLQSGHPADGLLRDWLDRNGIRPDDADAVRALGERLTEPHVMAMTVYTGHSHPLINNAITAQMVTHGVAEAPVRAIHDRKMNGLVDGYLAAYASHSPSEPLPHALHDTLHDASGLRPDAQRWVDAERNRLAAERDAEYHQSRGDHVSADRALAEADRARAEAKAARQDIGRDLKTVAPRLFDEVRWHADMVYDALRQLPTVGTRENPVIAFRGDWSSRGWSPVYGSPRFPHGTALSVLSLSRLPDVAMEFMVNNAASDNRVLAVYKLTGENARDISVFSALPHEQEAVLPPGSHTRQVSDPVLEQQVRDQLPPEWRDRAKVIVLEERPNPPDTASNVEPGRPRGSGESQQYFHHAEADPLAKWGSAQDTHPQEWNDAIEEARAAGVEVTIRPGGLAYGPGPSPGRPGQLILDPAASYGALLHEMQHMRDDQAVGWGGMRAWFEDEEVRYQGEVRAYQREIQYAESIGDRDSVEKLHELLHEEYLKITERDL